MDRLFSVTIGDLHENGLSCPFSISDYCDDEGEASITGHVKWDGCMDWQTNPNCMAHLCEPEAVPDLAWAFREAWRLCGDAMGDKYDQNAPRPVEPPQ